MGSGICLKLNPVEGYPINWRGVPNAMGEKRKKWRRVIKRIKTERGKGARAPHFRLNSIVSNFSVPFSLELGLTFLGSLQPTTKTLTISSVPLLRS